MRNAPSYKRRPIASVAALARALGVSEDLLTETAERADSLYRLAKVIRKSDGRERRVYQAIEPLYGLQARVVGALLRSVDFPDYLMGGIADPSRTRGFVRNAAQHSGSALLISEDAADFFPSITRAQVTSIFLHVFHFLPQIASLLAKLCTREGALPQGGSPSTYLANLVLFRDEPSLATTFSSEGLRYSRFIDDIYVSSYHRIPPHRVHAAVVRLRRLLETNGFKAKRSKQEIRSRGSRRTAHNLNVDAKRPTVPNRERKNIRAFVATLERRAHDGTDGNWDKDLQRAAGRVAYLRALHPKQGLALMRRVQSLRANASRRTEQAVSNG